jgi:hypothetical protein
MKTLVTFTLGAAIIAASLLGAGSADAARPAQIRLPLAYDQLGAISHPAGHYTLPPARLRGERLGDFEAADPGAKVGFNPQPDPPGDV